MDEDDWLDPQAQGSSADPLVEQEYQRLATRYSDAGYREGITDGKLSTLQQGFDDSFAASVGFSRTLGRLRGRCAALLHFATNHAPSSANGDFEAVIHEIRELMHELGRVRRVDILPKDLEREAHEEEHGEGDELDDTPAREMEGLEEAMGGMGGAGAGVTAVVGGSSVEGVANGEREDELLRSLGGKLRGLEARVLGAAR